MEASGAPLRQRTRCNVVASLKPTSRAGTLADGGARGLSKRPGDKAHRRQAALSSRRRDAPPAAVPCRAGQAAPTRTGRRTAAQLDRKYAAWDLVDWCRPSRTSPRSASRMRRVRVARGVKPIAVAISLVSSPPSRSESRMSGLDPGIRKVLLAILPKEQNASHGGHAAALMGGH